MSTAVEDAGMYASDCAEIDRKRDCLMNVSVVFIAGSIRLSSGQSSSCQITASPTEFKTFQIQVE